MLRFSPAEIKIRRNTRLERSHPNARHSCHHPVSYTHLDVYKRQPFYAALFQGKCDIPQREGQPPANGLGKALLKLSLIHICMPVKIACPKSGLPFYPAP